MILYEARHVQGMKRLLEYGRHVGIYRAVVRALDRRIVFVCQFVQCGMGLSVNWF